jgi:hypothetical protein
MIKPFKRDAFNSIHFHRVISLILSVKIGNSKGRISVFVLFIIEFAMQRVFKSNVEGKEGVPEGINSKIQEAKGRAGGYRDVNHSINMIYFLAAKLKLDYQRYSF